MTIWQHDKKPLLLDGLFAQPSGSYPKNSYYRLTRIHAGRKELNRKMKNFARLRKKSDNFYQPFGIIIFNAEIRKFYLSKIYLLSTIVHSLTIVITTIKLE